MDCLESLKKQTFQNFEIIIVDDCSTDDSYEKLQKLAETEEKIRLFQNDKNRGVGYTKKKCVEYAKGTICGFVDPDDAIVENALELSLNRYNNSKIIATYSKIYFCDDKLAIKEIYSRSKRIRNKNQLFFNINNEVSHFFTFRKDTYLKTIGINEQLSSAVDFDIYLKLYEIGDFSFINKPLYYYRRHIGGISQDKSKRDKVYENWNKVIYDTCKRRDIEYIYGEKVTDEKDLVKVIFRNENITLKKVIRLVNRVWFSILN